MVFLLVLFVPSIEAQAQVEDPEIPAGGRVRVVAPSFSEASVVGRFTGFDDDSLSVMELRAQTASRIPIRSIERVDLSVGRARGRGAVVGGLIGLGGGVGLGLVCAVVCGHAAAAPVGGLVVGVFVGLPMGALIGASVFAPDQWQPIRIE